MPSPIIAGFILPFLGGSYVTVSGPAAGLAPILLASMMVLGRGDLATIGATYHSSSPGRGELEGRMAVAPWQSGVGLALSRLAAPLTRTEFVFTPADARWLQMVVVDEQGMALGVLHLHVRA